MSKRIDLTGQTFGDWYVEEYAGDQKYRCRCSCGKIKLVKAFLLTSGGSTNCGHLRARKAEDLTGRQYGEWTVLKKDESKPRYWICRCSCGKESSVMDYALKSGTSKSCGHLESGRYLGMQVTSFGSASVPVVQRGW